MDTISSGQAQMLRKDRDARVRSPILPALFLQDLVGGLSHLMLG